MAIKYAKLLIELLLTLITLSSSGFTRADDAFADQSARFGIYAGAFPNLSVLDLEVYVKVLTEQVSKDDAIKSSVTIFKDVTLMRKAFEQGEINYVVASTLNLANDFDNIHFADGFKLITSNEFNNSLVIMTRKNEGLDDFKSLKGKRLTLAESDPIAELYTDVLSLAHFKKTYKESFSAIQKEKKTQQVILKLFFGNTDVICLFRNAYIRALELNPQLETKLQIISQINNISPGAGFFHKNTPENFREKVINNALLLDSQEKGREFLQLFRADKAVRSTLADLAGVQQLYQDYRTLKSKAGKK